MLNRRRGEDGSGMTIAVAILFPMLVTVVMVLEFVTDSARIEQSLQATANRAARTASLCCYRTGDAQQAAKAVIAAAERDAALNRVRCNNDLAADSLVVFEDAAGGVVAVAEDADGDFPPVPPAGIVHVYLRCVVPPQLLGGSTLGIFDAQRTVAGAATVDPYRSRPGT